MIQGIKRQAEPKDMLGKRYQQFQRRLARHYINTINGEDDNNIMDGGTGVSTVGNTNTTSGTSRNQVQGSLQENSNRENRGSNGERRVFATIPISSSNTSSSTTLPTQSLSRDTDRGQSSAYARTGRDASLVRSNPSVLTSAPLSNATFQIFSDLTPDNLVNTELTENENWRNLGTQSEKRKENDGKIFMNIFIPMTSFAFFMYFMFFFVFFVFLLLS